MCGIAGCYNFHGRVDRERFEQMVDMAAHRGPDGRGCFYQGGLALGHRRLSVIDLSEEGRQPFFYKNRYVVVYNGEIYNYKELRKELASAGIRFSTKTDTEVLAAAYDYYGRACVQYLNGMWAFAVYDRKKHELYCCRDRFGIKPFYYYLDKEQFLFGSEIKQILHMLKKRACANRKRLLEFLVRGDQDYTVETMFLDIMQLRGGCEIKLNLSNKEFAIEQYYSLDGVKECTSSYQESCERFSQAFRHAVKIRMRSDVPIGYCLSGGLDSSAIVTAADDWMRRTGQKTRQHAVSSCFEDPAYDEQEYIDEVVKQTGVFCHKVFPDADRLFEETDQMIWQMDEPFGSTSIYAQWNVFREARAQGLTVMLDGQGADEQLGGYTAFYGVHFADLLKRGRLFSFIRELWAYQRLRASTETYVNTGRMMLSSLSGVMIPDSLHHVASGTYLEKLGLPFTTEQLRIVYQDRVIYPMNDARQYILDSMQCGMQALLHYEDRDSMAFSIESRVPFLDHELVEAVFAMPFAYKIKNGITKAVMRDGLEDILPEKIRMRYSKLGFVTPEDQWINKNYGQFCRELEQACDMLAPLLDRQQVMQWFYRQKGKAVRGDFTAWRMICAGRWAGVFDVLI